MDRDREGGGDIGDIDYESASDSDGEAFELNDETLDRVKRNDPEVAGLVIGSDTRIPGAGDIIGKSTILQLIRLAVYEQDINARSLLDELFRGLAKNRSVEGLHINYYSEDEEPSSAELLDGFHFLSPFLEHNSSLRMLTIHGFSLSQVPTSLARVSLCKDCRLERIAITYTIVTDDDAGRLVDSMNCISTLQEFTFKDNNLESMNCFCQALAKLLRNPASNIRRLRITYNTTSDGHLDNQSIIALRDAFTSNRTLVFLDLYGMYTMTANGLRILSEALSNPNCTIKKLSLRETNISDDDMRSLGVALAVNTTLIDLDLSFNFYITSTGLREFFQWTRNQNSSLKKLNLATFEIDDVGAGLIALALVQNRSINQFNIECNHSITSSGWLNFFEVLLNGNRSLEMLIIDPDGLTDECWNTMSSALCDSSNIESIYWSNHIFYNICIRNYQGVPGNVMSLLEINANQDKAQVVRQKILKYHFSGGSANIHIFSEMPESMMPYVLEWIGHNNLGYSLMHTVIRDFPTLLGNCNKPLYEGGGKKQKC